MEVTRIIGNTGYIYEIVDGSNSMNISLMPNKDLCFACNNRHNDRFIPINITRENEVIYNLFSNLYDDIIDANIFSDEDKNNELKESNLYNGLVKNNAIYYKSDDQVVSNDNKELYNSMIICKENDNILIQFNFYDRYDHSVIVKKDNSRYGEFNIPFNNLYQNLLEYDPLHHQIHINEYNYQKRKIRK